MIIQPRSGPGVTVQSWILRSAKGRDGPLGLILNCQRDGRTSRFSLTQLGTVARHVGSGRPYVPARPHARNCLIQSDGYDVIRNSYKVG